MTNAARKVVIHWHRRDLRVEDNSALAWAAQRFDRVVPCYVLSGWTGSHRWTGPKRQRFLCDSLAALDKNLGALGGRLVLRCGAVIDELGALVRESGATAICFNRDPDPFGKGVESDLEAACQKWGVECHGFDDVTVHRPDEVLTQAGDPYRVYTPYSKTWMSLDKPEPVARPKKLDTPKNLESESLPGPDHWGLDDPSAEIVEAGERAARKRLEVAIDDRLGAYSADRDKPSVEGTSRLSQDLRWGLLSPRTVYWRAEEARREASNKASDGYFKFIKELAWREFYMAILDHFPEVLDEEFNADWRGLPWSEPDEKWEAWQAGRTGFPLVDAGMRQLLATGYMHNRLRMVTAMFLTKDLHLDWRLGEAFFMRHLVDGEIASNNGGWQWSAGTGADAAPYFRIQNPWSQSARHDPDGRFIRRWVPELADVSTEQLHQPPGGKHAIAADYPLPCVDHAEERDRTMKMFKQHKEARAR